MSKNELDLTKPIQRRNGLKVDWFRVLNGDRTYPIMAIGPDKDGRDQYTTSQLDGRIASNQDSDYDLINVPEKQTVWAYNMGKSQPIQFRAERCNTLDNCCISRVRVEFEAGRMDE